MKQLLNGYGEIEIDIGSQIKLLWEEAVNFLWPTPQKKIKYNGNCVDTSKIEIPVNVVAVFLMKNDVMIKVIALVTMC